MNNRVQLVKRPTLKNQLHESLYRFTELSRIGQKLIYYDGIIYPMVKNYLKAQVLRILNNIKNETTYDDLFGELNWKCFYTLDNFKFICRCQPTRLWITSTDWEEHCRTKHGEYRFPKISPWQRLHYMIGSALEALQSKAVRLSQRRSFISVEDLSLVSHFPSPESLVIAKDLWYKFVEKFPENAEWINLYLQHENMKEAAKKKRISISGFSIKYSRAKNKFKEFMQVYA